MRDIDDEFDSTDVVRYVHQARGVVAGAVDDRADLTQPVTATMVVSPAFDDSELEAVIAQLDAEQHKGEAATRRA